MKTGKGDFQKTSRLAVARRIAVLHRRGEPLNISAVKRKHPRLLQRVYAMKPFWGWKQAVEAAGLDYSDLQVELRDHLVCEICGAQLRVIGTHLLWAHRMSSEEYLESFPGAELLSEEKRAKSKGHPAWRSNRTRDDRRIAHWEPIWTPEYVLDRIFEYQRLGVPVSYTEIKKVEIAFIIVAEKYYGCWGNALNLVGINPDDVRHPIAVRYPTPASVIEAIKKRQVMQMPQNYKAVAVGPHSDSALLCAGRKFFGGWRNALEAAGLDYSKISPQYPRFPTKESMTREIRRRASAGLPLNVRDMNYGPDRDVTLCMRASEAFGTWGDAIREAGLDYSRIIKSKRSPYRSPEDVLEKIRQRKRSGLPISLTSLRCDESKDSSLLYAGIKLFGNWGNAVAAAEPDG